MNKMKLSLLKPTLLVLLLFPVLFSLSCKNNRINQFDQLNSSSRELGQKESPAKAVVNKPEILTDTARTCDTASSDEEKRTSVARSVSGKIYLKVTRVIDGDTFVILNNDGSDEKIRLTGVNAPESRNTGKKKKEEFGIESKAFLSKFLTGKMVRLEFDVQKTDRYGRTLAYVYLEDGTFLNEYLVKEGYAQVATFPPNVKYKDTFIAAQRYARENKTGLWK
ncbi:MAG: thermonuclease family protein [Bacteroidales bacterium]|jgi:micrococcal nuclease